MVQPSPPSLVALSPDCVCTPPRKTAASAVDAAFLRMFSSLPHRSDSSACRCSSKLWRNEWRRAAAAAEVSSDSHLARASAGQSAGEQCSSHRAPGMLGNVEAGSCQPPTVRGHLLCHLHRELSGSLSGSSLRQRLVAVRFDLRAVRSANDRPLRCRRHAAAQLQQCGRVLHSCICVHSRADRLAAAAAAAGAPGLAAQAPRAASTLHRLRAPASRASWPSSAAARPAARLPRPHRGGRPSRECASNARGGGALTAASAAGRTRSACPAVETAVLLRAPSGVAGGAACGQIATHR